jgi:hypothetical protein
MIFNWALLKNNKNYNKHGLGMFRLINNYNHAHSVIIYSSSRSMEIFRVSVCRQYYYRTRQRFSETNDGKC